MASIAPTNNIKTYAQARLQMGITTVGFWVIICSLALWLDLPEIFANWSFSKTLLTLLGGYILISAPFDLIGGYLLPKQYGRWSEPFTSWLSSWARGVSAQAVLMYFSALGLWAVLQASQSVSIWLGGVILLQLLFAIGQTVIATIVGQFNSTDAHNIWQSNDIGFTGGISLLGQSTLPEHWQENLSHHEWEWITKRRDFIKQSGASLWGAMGAIIFNTLGVWVVISVSQLQFITPVDWVTVVLGMTLWAFLGILVLPSLSQQAILAIDRQCPNTTAAHSLIKTLDSFQDEEPSRHPWIQRIFHPLPSVEQRLENLKQQSHQATSSKLFVFWHIARRMLFYSWPMMNLLNRAVHCNVGRPDCWVFLPSEG